MSAFFCNFAAEYLKSHKRMKKKFSLVFLSLLTLVGCNANYPGEMDTPEAAAEVIEIHDLNTSVDVPNGVYDLEVYVRGSEDSLLVVEANSRKGSVLLHEAVWTRGYVRGIDVADGKLALHAQTIEPGGKFALSIAYLHKASAKRELIKGGDFSMLSLVEQNGGTYADREGKKGDCFEICAREGMNLARLRLYNDPGNPANYPSKAFFTGIQDEENILQLAKRAQAAGMQIELTFHYSDFWTNGGQQYKPAAWQDYSFEQLKEAMYTYTRDFLKKMVAQGTTPQYVSLGNEIQSGILFGVIENYAPTDSINGYCDDMNKLGALLQQGSKAVREVCPEAKIVLHLTTSSDITAENFKWFFSAMKNANVDYDIIGASYYPFYGNKTIEEMVAAAETLCAIYDKDFIFMEVGFAWAEKMPDGSDGQISNNKPYTDMTKEAQRKFMLDLTTQILAGSPRLLGYIYWDPIYLDAPNCGWAAGEKNVTANSTLFDFDGVMLPAWDAIKYN